jgi:hypothetical protein
MIGKSKKCRIEFPVFADEELKENNNAEEGES